jgi:hypothetical protein
MTSCLGTITKGFAAPGLTLLADVPTMGCSLLKNKRRKSNNKHGKEIISN